MNLKQDLKLDFKDVLITPKRSTLTSRSEVDINRQLVYRHSKEVFDGVPIIAANMDTVGTFEMAKALSEYGMCVALHKHYKVEELKSFFMNEKDYVLDKTFYSMGITEADAEKYKNVCDELARFEASNPKNICIDVANGYTETFVDFVKKFRDNNPGSIVMAGNVVTGEMVEALILAGADIVKVGIGPGSACTTRVLTGVGYPQLSAIIECADSAHGLSGQICADGGCTIPGDVAKAFGAGADFVMLGGMLSAHDECEGEIVEKDGKKFHQFYGMSSETAMIKHSGGVAEYKASEGKTVLVPYKGPVENTVKEILGGLRSAMTYVGARKLKEFTKRTTFVRVSQQENKVFD